MNRSEFVKKALLTSASATIPFYTSFSTKDSNEIECNLFEFKPLFNGKDLSGFVDVNTSKETWRVEDGILICTGHPIGVIRTKKQYENFILEIEWRHMEPGGNSGVFVWADGTPYKDNPFPTGMEVQMLGPEVYEIRNYTEEYTYYAHGQLFPVMGLEGTIPDNPFKRIPSRSDPLEARVKGRGEWNTYIIVCVDGTIKLSVNGKFVNGIRSLNRKKGYICPESEGYEVHFRSMNIMELPSGVITSDQVAPLVETLNGQIF
jgi:hypothetical protein